MLGRHLGLTYATLALALATSMCGRNSAGASERQFEAIENAKKPGVVTPSADADSAPEDPR